jgi:MFS family permease
MTTPEGQPLPHRDTLIIVFGVLVSVFLGSIQQSITASALPTIGHALGATGDLSWIVTAYLLTQIAATPLFGKYSDSHGRRKALQISLVIFVIGSLACALAPNIGLLVAARALQGIAAGGLTAIPMTILGDLAPPKFRTRYYTYFSMTYISAGTLGPALGGFFAEYLHWSMIFWFGIPIGVAAYFITGHVLKKLPPYHRRHKMDFAGAVLIVLASLTFMFALTTGGKSYAWLSPQIIGLIVLSMGLWLAFIWRQKQAEEPLLPLGIVSNPIVRWAIISNACGWGAIIGVNIYLPVWLQTIGRMGPTESGLALMILMIMLNLGALVGAQLAARLTHYKRPPMILLLVCMGATVWMAWRAEGMDFIELQIVVGLFGFCFGPVAPVTSVAMQNTIVQHQLGTAVAAMQFARGLLTSFVVALFGVIVLHVLPDSAGAGAEALKNATDREATVAAFRTLFFAATGLLALSFVTLAAMEERPLLTKRKE